MSETGRVYSDCLDGLCGSCDACRALGVTGRGLSDAEIVQTAPEVVMDARGFFWRRHYDGSLSMLPTSTDNDPTAYPLVCYQPVDVERQP